MSSVDVSTGAVSAIYHVDGERYKYHADGFDALLQSLETARLSATDPSTFGVVRLSWFDETTQEYTPVEDRVFELFLSRLFPPFLGTF